MIEKSSGPKFISQSYFIIPVWLGDTDTLKNKISDYVCWQQCSADELRMEYLLKYAEKLTKNSHQFVRYKYCISGNENLYMYQCRSESFEKEIKLDSIELSCFGTGVGFIEIGIQYGDLSVEHICDFINKFKKVNNAEKSIAYYGCNYKSLKNLLAEIMPEGCNTFFHITATFKEECLGFHFIKYPNGVPDENEAKDLMYRLSRGYGMQFTQHEEKSDYDFLYTPYKNDIWSGSQEGLANLVYSTGNEENDFFINTYKLKQLKEDYRFIYLLLLNQRFASLKYIEMLAEANDQDFKAINKRVIELKLQYSYKVISSDLLYQNIFSKMYKILDIDALYEDLNESEEQVKLLVDQEAAKAGELGNRLLIALSVLTVFSTLIDMSSYLQLFGPTADIAKWISCIFVMIVIMCFLYKKK